MNRARGSDPDDGLRGDATVRGAETVIARLVAAGLARTPGGDPADLGPPLDCPVSLSEALAEQRAER